MTIFVKPLSCTSCHCVKFTSHYPVLTRCGCYAHSVTDTLRSVLSQKVLVLKLANKEHSCLLVSLAASQGPIWNVRLEPLLERAVVSQPLKDWWQIAACYLNSLPCHRNMHQTHSDDQYYNRPPEMAVMLTHITSLLGESPLCITEVS